MVEIPTVGAARERIGATIAALASPRDRAMMQVYRDHWLAEVRNDVPAIMATLPADIVSYRFQGNGLMIPEPLEFGTADEARALYQDAADRGLPMAGPFVEERWAFADWGMTFEGISIAITRGASLYGLPQAIDPAGFYLVRWRSMSLHPIDVERRLMLGEHVYTGSVVSLDPVEETAIGQMLCGS
jgi:hypothetical protein